MPFSKRFVLLVLFGIVPVCAGWYIDAAFAVSLLYNGLLSVLFITDLFVTSGKKRLEVSRECEEKLSLGAINPIVIRIRNNTRHLLKITFRDDVPEGIKVQNPMVNLIAPPHLDSMVQYNVIPVKRGQFIFGDISARYTGVLGLCTRTVRFPCEHAYKVYPNLRDLRRLSLAAINKSQLIYGFRKTRAYSAGTEFESLREYNRDDDYRKINWMATARENKLIVNNYQPERNQQVFIILDSSRVMNSEINSIKKLDYAVNSAFLLANTAVKKGDSTGLMVFDSTVRRFIKPGKGSSQFQLIAEQLYNIEENLVTADYTGALLYLNGRQNKRSLLCIFTDLFSPMEALELTEIGRASCRERV